jgi:putative transcriptional regulator
MVRYTVPRMARVLSLTLSAVVLGTLAVLGVARPLNAVVGPLAQADKSLTGQFLVATEELQDPRFARTVIYIVRHDGSGAMGLVVNRPIGNAPLAPLLRQFGLDDHGVGGTIPVHYGGPVESTRGFVLHTAEYATQGTDRIAGDIALSTRPEVLADIARGAGPRRFLFALGYAGWGAGQLENEIDAGAWITVPADPALLFDDDYAHKWERATSRRRLNI